MIDLARWALVHLGLVYLVTEAAIFAPVRLMVASRGPLWTTLIYCPGCSGFWLGLAVTHLWPEPAWWLALPCSGVAGMGLAATWSKVTGGNQAWSAEEPLRGSHDETPPSQAPHEGD